MTSVVVLGNGVSRLMFDVARIPHRKVGCNWAVRDLRLDALCTVDRQAYTALRGCHPHHFHTPLKGSLDIYHNDQVWGQIPPNQGLCSGRLAVWVAAHYFKATTVYLLGVDFQSHLPDLVNNVYATTGHKTGRSATIYEEWRKLLTHLPSGVQVVSAGALDPDPGAAVPGIQCLTSVQDVRTALWPQDCPTPKDQATFITPESP